MNISHIELASTCQFASYILSLTGEAREAVLTPFIIDPNHFENKFESLVKWFIGKFKNSSKIILILFLDIWLHSLVVAEMDDDSHTLVNGIFMWCWSCDDDLFVTHGNWMNRCRKRRMVHCYRLLFFLSQHFHKSLSIRPHEHNDHYGINAGKEWQEDHA